MYCNRRCVKDCAEDGPLDDDHDCGGILEDGWVQLYDSADECCDEEMGWQDPDACVAAATGTPDEGTNAWYVDWTRER